MTAVLTEEMFLEVWPRIRDRFSVTVEGLRTAKGVCPLCEASSELGINPYNYSTGYWMVTDYRDSEPEHWSVRYAKAADEHGGSGFPPPRNPDPPA